MKIGMRAHDFGRMDENALAAKIKQAGFDAVQLAPTKAIVGINNFSDITAERLYAAKTAFDKYRVEINVYGCYIDPALLDKEKRLEQVEFFKKGLEFAKLISVPIVATETTNFAIENEAQRENSYSLLKDSVLRMAEKAEKENVIIGIEPVSEHTLNTPELAKRLLDEVKSSKLKIIFDPVNLLLPNTVQNQDEIFTKFFELLGEEVVAVHLKDTVVENGVKKWRNMGDGLVNYPLIFDWLKQNKPDIRVLLEDVNPESYKTDLAAIQKLIG